MKLFKAVASVASIAALIALVAAPSAFATETSLCKSNPTTPFVCPAGEQYASGTTFKGGIGATPEKALLVMSLASVECMSSLEGKISSSTASPLPAVISALTWSECHVVGQPMGLCLVTSVHLPFNATINWTGADKGTLTLTTGTGGKPGFVVECVAGVACEYLMENAALTAVGGASGTAFVEAKELALEKGDPRCQQSKLNAKYFLSSPTPVFIAK